MAEPKITFNADEKFDLQLSQALIDERRLAHFFEHCDLHRVELKSESFIWEKSGNICVEYMRDGKPSGLAVTKADAWVHELKRKGQTVMYAVFPIEQLKALTRSAIRAGRWRDKAGDGGRQRVALLRLRDLLNAF